MYDLNALTAILKDFVARLTAKRLAVLALYLAYMAYLFQAVVGKAAVNNSDTLTLEAVVFVGLPTLVVIIAIIAFTKVGGGDDMLEAVKEAAADAAKTEPAKPSVG